jgi:hypothetical protein
LRIGEKYEFGFFYRMFLLKSDSVKTIRFLPFTYIAGMHGFVFFVPYLALCVGLIAFGRHRSRLAPAPELAPARI